MNRTQKEEWKGRTLLFFTSQCVTLFGSTLVQMAVVWYATLETSSGLWVSAFSICSYLPQFLLSLPGGLWADRCSRKRLIIGADLAIAFVTLLMICLLPEIEGGTPLLASLLLMSALRSAGAGIQTPAVNAEIPRLVPEEERLRFNGINAAMQSVVQFAAPAAAGILLTVSDLRMVLWIDVLTAVIGTGILSGVRLSEQKILIYGLFVFLCVPAGFLAGLLVKRVYGDTYGYLTAVELTGFLGMTAGGLLMSRWRGFQRKERTLAVGLSVFGLMAALMGMTECFPMYLTFMAVYGVALTVVQTVIVTLLQEHTKESEQGRIFGLQSSVYAGALPLGMAIFGPLADVMPLQRILVLSGIALLCLAAIADRSR
ncbi:MAG TPA: MFS transporter [Candidatus Merdisoma merdipullorum]|nr:MFS transporter [Candidatus Merdisoma merdipullorum]